MDIKLINLNKEKIVSEEKIDKELFKDKISKILKIDIIKEDYYIDKDNNDYIEMIFVDENKRIGIIEFREGIFSPVIKNGLSQIDYINNHLSEFKILVNDYYKENKDIIYDPYLIVISSLFTKTDYNAICHIPYDIKLISLNKYEKCVVANCAYVSRKVNFSNFKSKIVDEKLCKDIVDSALSLSEEVCLYGYCNKIVFSRLFSFGKIEFKDNKLCLYIKKKDKWVEENLNNMNKVYLDIELSFNEN